SRACFHGGSGYRPLLAAIVPAWRRPSDVLASRSPSGGAGEAREAPHLPPRAGYCTTSRPSRLRALDVQLASTPRPATDSRPIQGPRKGGILVKLFSQIALIVMMATATLLAGGAMP